MQGMDRKPFERTFDFMKQEYQKWEPTYKELSKYIDPERGFFDGQITNDPNVGIDYKILLNSTPTDSVQTLAAGMRGGLTSPALPWFRLGVSDPDLSEYQAVRMYLDDVQQILFDIYAKSNFYDVMYSLYEELGTFGTAAVIIEEDYKTTIRCRCFTAGEYYLGTGADGRVNSFARIIQMNALQMVRKFGIDNVSESVKTAYDNSTFTTMFSAYHLIEENDDRIEGRKDFKNMLYRSIYWEPGSTADTYLRIGGYQEFPIIAPRWDIVANDIYGKNNPGRRGLGDSRELQTAEEQYLIALDKVINPPVQKSSSTDMVNALPGGISTYGQTENQKIIPVYQISPPLQEIEQRISTIEGRIKAKFYTDIFLMLQSTLDDPRKTATEIIELKQEKMQILGPVLERIFGEGLNPGMERTFNIANRVGRLPEPPKEIQGMELKIEYTSLLAMAQKASSITTIQQTATFVMSIAGAYPDVVDKFDADEAVDQIAEMNGTPPKVVRSDEDVAKIRQQKHQAQQAAAQMQALDQVANSAKTLSGADLGSNNALTALMGGGTQR
ncbi:MAG TPA: hypothetical protein DDW50_21025 [Firmicutes bacterium]|jgi:hypothetical protein|nr:hypothetical protein [Bacillota bacterium]